MNGILSELDKEEDNDEDEDDDDDEEESEVKFCTVGCWLRGVDIPLFAGICLLLRDRRDGGGEEEVSATAISTIA